MTTSLRPEAGPRRGSLSDAGALERMLLVGAPLAALVAVAGLLATGELAAQLLLDPGPAVRYGLPIARSVHHVAAALTIGLLVLAAFVLPSARDRRGLLGLEQFTAVRWASRAAAVWFVAALAVAVLSTANSIGQGVTSDGFADQVVFYLTRVELGQSLAVSALLVLATLALSVRPASVTRLGVATALSVLALLPLALSGHAAGADEHANAVNSLAVHLIGVCLWAGGLGALVLLRGVIGDGLGIALQRYSTLALVAFGLVAFSGVVNASLRVSPSDLVQTPYGALLLAKTAALIALGLAGLAQRRRAIPLLLRDPHRAGVFARVAVLELLVMSVTFGLSVALSRSAPPISQAPVADVRHALLGRPYPPEYEPLRLLTEVHIDWVWALIAVSLAGAYLLGVRRLRRRGDAWPLARTLWWLVGCAFLLWATSGGPAVYGSVHFSTHMLQHMVLMMYAPMPLVLGAPILLLLRAVPPRQDGSRGVREWTLALLHSRYSRVMTRPAVAGVIFAGSLVVFYFTGWFEAAMFEHGWHVFMQVHFLASGYLFFWVLLGLDPGIDRPRYPVRLLVLLATMVFHAFFGIVVMSSTEVLAPHWWAAMQYTDTAALLADQTVGGSFAWGAGEAPVIIAALMIAVQWMRSDEREAKRADRKADQDDDAALRAYNARLAQMAGTLSPDRRPEDRSGEDPAPAPESSPPPGRGDSPSP